MWGRSAEISRIFGMRPRVPFFGQKGTLLWGRQILRGKPLASQKGRLLWDKRQGPRAVSARAEGRGSAFLAEKSPTLLRQPGSRPAFRRPQKSAFFGQKRPNSLHIMFQ